ncbi:RNA polymerase sigma factor [Nonomuraea sp. SYSU D8015]|uniref:RNA polymerase sigma factor n=1 Tax=Nonomuraea sp. SYSU D8015 TaxID=2593644 RepID=UPI0016605467|nr:sigma-70 family RNA polymerase sigma factor [Nonomuraea sp. SYSU D8015]
MSTSHLHEDDQTLRLRFQAGDDTALRQVWERYGGALFATALNLLGDPGLAEEAVQDALVRMWRSAGNFDASRELAPWLYQIVRRCAVDVHRRHNRRPATAPLPELPIEAEPADDRLWLVRAAVRELEPAQREVVELMYFQGLGHQAVADRLGIPVGTVKSRASRACRRLADQLT